MEDENVEHFELSNDRMNENDLHGGRNADFASAGVMSATEIICVVENYWFYDDKDGFGMVNVAKYYISLVRSATRAAELLENEIVRITQSVLTTPKSRTPPPTKMNRTKKGIKTKGKTKLRLKNDPNV